MKLVISPQAASDIEVALRWWLANRPKAPELLEQELKLALEFIERTPLAGIPLAPREVGLVLGERLTAATARAARSRSA